MKKLSLRNFIIAISVALVLLVACTFTSGGFFGDEAYRAENIYVGLANCLTVPGMMLLCAAALSWISTFGLFDMLMYGSQTLLALVIKPIAEKLPPNFYEYRKQKDEKGRRWSLETLIVGAGFFLVGMIFVVISLFVG